ncbi:MAG: glycogen/starch synthase [Desulfobulbaceae bacterium]|jgi:starch synthase|nr:glycogen/starch synthase [Desulfobulbaceae bacterium]
MRENIAPVWMVSREYGDLAGAGGVKDVARQLAESLATQAGLPLRVALPSYGFINPQEYGFALLDEPHYPGRPLEFIVDMNYGSEEREERCRVWWRQADHVLLYLIEADRFREKHGVYTYTERDVGPENPVYGRGHYDYFAMNVLLQKSALELMIILGEKPDVIHCHDGHTALIPALIHQCPGWRSYFRETGCLVTIHNAGVGYHQEVADLTFAQAISGLPWREITAGRLAGKFDPFLSAGRHAVMNTVSENYARELQATDADVLTDWLGHTLLQNGVRLEGVTNGICPELFDPGQPERMGIAAAYSPGDECDRELSGKKACKMDLLHTLAASRAMEGVRQFGAVQAWPDAPLFTFVGRLGEQKGVDVLLAAMPNLLRRHADTQFVILGSGGEEYEGQLKSLAEEDILRGRVCYLRGYNPQVANKVYAAGDFFLIPSRYEPCGLTDYIAQLFGNIPLVRHVGGLVKVLDGETGLAYDGNTPNNLLSCLKRALDLYGRRDEMRRIQTRAVRLIHEQYTWDVVMGQYLRLYRQAKERRLRHFSS